MSHELVEKTSGLASRTNNLAVHEASSDSRRLLELQDKLAELALLAIVKDLRDEHADYKAAIVGLDNAIAFIGDATGRIENVAEAIRLTAKAAALVEQAIKTAAA